MTDEQKSIRRAAMIEKVRKIMAIARDGRGNVNEEQAALERANALMAEYGIAEAECDMGMLDRNEMEYGEVEVGLDGQPLKPGKVYRKLPTWTSMLSLGVARFTDTIVGTKTTASGLVFVYRGEKNDVLFARWLLGVLVEAVQREQKASGWTGIRESTEFRNAAGSTLAKRLRTLSEERRATYQKAQADSGCRAIMVVDRKQAEIAKYFGRQHTKSVRYSKSTGAHIAGSEAGSRITIPTAPPVGGSTTQRKAIGG